MKTIQMTIDEQLLEQVDEAVETLNTNRSAFIREALEQVLKEYRIRLMDEQVAEAYTRIPDDVSEVEIWREAQVWGDEWGDEWKEEK
jgi:metal-responsive CopG/Arc/MetJ family transcriptional regulator